MTVSAGQPVSATVVNNAFISRTDDSSTSGKITLENVDSATIDDIQNATNEVFDAVGMTGEGDATRKDYSSNNFVSNGDSHKVAIGKLDTALDAHLDDTADAHAASAITNTPTGNLAATTVQAALNELQGDIDALGSSTALTDHINDNTGAHAASAISSVASGNLVATDVQAALNELQSDIDTRATSSDLTNHMSDTTTHGTTGDIVGTSDSQTLSSKTFSDAITGTEISTPANPASGKRKIYPKTDGWYDLDSAGLETKIGTGSGGGGGLAVLATYSSDQDNSTWTTGNNATWGTFTGSLLGTFTKQSAVTPIRGTYSYLYQANAGVSLNDFVVSEAVTIPLEFRNRYIAISAQVFYSGADNEFALKIWDNSNNNELSNSDIAYVKSVATPTTLVKAVFVPASCSSIRFGFHAVSEPSASAVLKFDSVEITRDPFVYKDVIQECKLEASGNGGTAYTSGVTDIPFTSETIDSLGAFNGTVFTAPFSANFNVSAAVVSTASLSGSLSMYINGSQRFVGDTITSDIHTISFNPYLSVGDTVVIRRTGSSGTLLNSTFHRLSITAQTATEHVVTPATSPKSVNLTLSGGSYTSTVRAVGTYYQKGDGSHWLDFNATYNVSSGSRAGHAITLNGVIFKSGVNQAATGLNDAVGTTADRVYATGGASTVQSNHSTATTTQYFIQGTVELESIPTWATPTSSQYLAAVPVEQVAIVKHVLSGNGGTPTINAWTTRVLNTLSGDTSFCTLSSNQITLPSGKYAIRALAPFFQSSSFKTRLRNITDGTTVSLGTSGVAGAADNTQAYSHLSTILEITSSKVFELQYYVLSNTGGSQGLGVSATTTGESNDEYVSVEIRKIK